MVSVICVGCGERVASKSNATLLGCTTKVVSSDKKELIS